MIPATFSLFVITGHFNFFIVSSLRKCIEKPELFDLRAIPGLVLSIITHPVTMTGFPKFSSMKESAEAV